MEEVLRGGLARSEGDGGRDGGETHRAAEGEVQGASRRNFEVNSEESAWDAKREFGGGAHTDFTFELYEERKEEKKKIEEVLTFKTRGI